MGITVVLIRAAGTPAAQRALPLYLGLIMVAGVVFGPKGMHPATAVVGMQVSVPVRLGMWTAWLVAAAPAARALWSTPTLDYLRWLPVAPWMAHLVLAGLLVVLQTPWVLLFAIGGGALPALAALALAVGVHAVVAIRPRPGERWVQIAVLGTVVVLLAAPLPFGPAALAAVQILVGLAIALGAIPLAWRRAPERGRTQRSRALLPGAVLALAQCHLICAYRSHGPALLRALMLMLLGVGATYVLARANQLYDHELAVYSAVVMVFVTSFACAGPSMAIRDSERRLSWLLASNGVGASTRTGARLVASGAIGVGLGFFYGALVVYAVPMTPLGATRILAGAVAIAVARMWAAQRIVRWAERDRDTGHGRRGADDGGRLVAALALVLVAELYALGRFGDAAVPVFATLAFALSWERRPT